MCEDHDAGKEGRNGKVNDRQNKERFLKEQANKISTDILLN